MVDTIKWLPGKKVLLSPISFDHVDSKNSTVNVLASTDTVKNAPNKNENEPVSKQDEVNLANHYGWPNYWSTVGPWGGFANPSVLAVSNKVAEIQDATEADYIDEHHLRSVNEIKGDFTGYSVEGSDGKIGHVSDFVIDDTNWEISYLVVETSRLLVGNFILIAKDWVQDIHWSDKKVFVDIAEEQAKEAADFDTEKPITREYEAELYSKLGKPKHWD